MIEKKPANEIIIKTARSGLGFYFSKKKKWKFKFPFSIYLPIVGEESFYNLFET